MASRAEDRAAGGRPRSDRQSGIGAVVRPSLNDYYFNSLRLVPPNVVWGVGVVAVVVIGFAWPIGGLLLLPSLALPTAAIFRVAARIVRAEPDAGGHDAAWAYRHEAARILALGAVATVAILILSTNLVTGISAGTPAGLIIATLAGWGLVAVWCGLLAAWPMLVDPARSATPIRGRLRLAGAVLLVNPVRVGALALLVAAITVVSIVLTAAILTVSVSLVALLACRAVYPIADRLQPLPEGERQ